MMIAAGSVGALRCLAVALLLSTSTGLGALAQTATTTATATAPQIPQPEILVSLIRWTLMAVSQANATGNYTVLRELGSPDFQAANTAAKLSIDFASWRDQKISLAFAAINSPQLSQPPSIDAAGVLRIVGFYPTRPLQVGFDLSFRLVDGAWRHSGISLAAASAGAAAQPPPASENAKPGASPKSPKAAKSPPRK